LAKNAANKAAATIRNIGALPFGLSFRRRTSLPWRAKRVSARARDIPCEQATDPARFLETL